MSIVNNEIESRVVMKNRRLSMTMSQAVRVVNEGKNKISIPVKNGISFKHINGYALKKSEKEISVYRAMVINNMIALLSAQEATHIKKVQADFDEGKISSNDFMMALKKIQEGIERQSLSPIPSETQGLVVNANA